MIADRFPTAIAARDRAVTWWGGLSPRERVLVGTLGALLAAAVLLYGIVRPVQAARAAALADIRTYETLMARVRAAGTLGTAATPPARTGSPAEVLAASAAPFGLQPVLEAVPGGVRAGIADADYAAAINWMADVARTTTLSATRVELGRLPAPGRVTVTVEYRG